jgi:8-oxo-(d)GTP phosphatase
MDDPSPPGAGLAAAQRGRPAADQGAEPAAGEIRAAGAVLWRPGSRGPEVALIHRPRYDDWTFPKGKAEPGEHVLVTAVREVTEETGIRPVLGRPLPTIRYQAKGRPKRVDYWTATAAPGPSSDPAPAEVDDVVWLPLSAAEERLTYQHDAVLLSELTTGSGSVAGDLATVPFILLRHATAEPKQGWPGDDVLRPLDPPGREQAVALATLLACFGTAQVVSSATARCVDTVLPYAVRAGVTARAEPGLTIGAPVRAAEEQLSALLAERVPAIFCGHGETLPGQLTALCEHLHAEPPPDPALQKASFWVLHVARNAVADGAPALGAIERHAA